MLKPDNKNSNSVYPFENSNLVFSGKLELNRYESNLKSIHNNRGNKSLIMRVGLKTHQISEILASAGERHKIVHLILYDTDNEKALPPDIINDSYLTTGNKIEVNYSLTKCEKAILASLASGLKYKEIAKKHFISIHTVKKHMTNIYKKLDINNRSMAIIKYVTLIKMIYYISMLWQPEMFINDISSLIPN